LYYFHPVRFNILIPDRAALFDLPQFSHPVVDIVGIQLYIAFQISSERDNQGA
jgi:hypothetical protein